MEKFTTVFADGSEIITREDGSFERWNKDGRLHSNDDRPSVFIPEGSTPGLSSYHRNGELHREDGPAIIWTDGRQHYFLYDTHYPKWYWNIARKVKIVRYAMEAYQYVVNKSYDVYHEVFIGPRG